MSILHAAAVFVNQLADGDTARCEFNTRLFDPAGDRIKMWPALVLIPLGAFLDNISEPEHGFDVID